MYPNLHSRSMRHLQVVLLWDLLVDLSIKAAQAA